MAYASAPETATSVPPEAISALVAVTPRLVSPIPVPAPANPAMPPMAAPVATWIQFEERTGEKVSKLHLYYTGETGRSQKVTWPYSRREMKDTVQVFDEVVHKILDKDFSTRAKSLKNCEECDFKSYCLQSWVNTASSK